MSTVLISLGSPGSGKGTQAKRLYAYYKETSPLIGHGSAQSLLVEADGEQAVGGVKEGLREAIGVVGTQD